MTGASPFGAVPDGPSAAEAHGNGLSGKVALVTGATSGIGKATAVAFARAGCRLILAGRDRSRGEALAGEIAAAGGEAAFVAADVRRPDEIARMVATASALFGRLDIAFNNAGYQEPRAPLAEQPADAYDAVFDTNVRAVFLAMQAEIRAMPAGGVIVNNASVSGVRNPNPGLALYSASKAAVVSLTRSAAMEYAPAGIRINAVSPGRVETPMMLGAGIDTAVVAAGLPARRLGRPEEVAAAVVWLASPAAAFVVGHNLCVDGGFLAG